MSAGLFWYLKISIFARGFPFFEDKNSPSPLFNGIAYKTVLIEKSHDYNVSV